MKIIQPSVEFITPLNGPAVIERLKRCGRACYKLRCSKAAHPQMREVATQVLKGFYRKIPVLFDDIYMETVARPKEDTK